MKFVYEYRTAANERRRGEITASSRDAAYAELKARGIRPARLADAPGFFNRLFGRGKRWLAIGLLALACGALVWTVGRERRAAEASQDEAAAARSLLDAPVRRQIVGDAAVIEKGLKTGWAEVFASEGDRFLASFAVPGHPAAIRAIPETALRDCLAESPADAAAVSLESRQIRAIVAGMKDEIRALLADGWTYAEVGAALVKRQEREIAYYGQARKELAAAEAAGADLTRLVALWEEKNAALRKMGIRLLPFPE